MITTEKVYLTLCTLRRLSAPKLTIMESQLACSPISPLAKALQQVTMNMTGAANAIKQKDQFMHFQGIGEAYVSNTGPINCRFLDLKEEAFCQLASMHCS